VPRTYATEPLPIARWGAEITLEGHQVAGARRVLEQRGGLVAFDVGVGKTYTAIAIVGRARQEGWARRPVVLVPGSLVWKWKRDFERCLPDYRVAVIGSERTRLTRGKRYRDVQELLKAGQITDADAERMLLSSRTDTPEERAAKWRDFQAGAYDVAILSFDALGRTRIGEDTVERHLRRTDQVMRSIELTLRSTADKPEKKLTERQKAIKQMGLRGWIQDKLRAPKTWKPDPGILWEELGIDLLVVDEAAAFKNLYLPERREGGAVRYMGGSGGEGSKRAWSFEFRAAVVRERTGGAGIVLLSATPAKNSPVEFFNIIQYIDHAAWRDRGIRDPEHFIDRYCKIDLKPVVTASFDVEVRPAVVGFTNLDELRAIIFRYGEFRTAREVGIKLPQPRIHRVEVVLDPKQRAKYDDFVAQVEAALKKGKSSSVLGFLARLALVAVHGDLDEGYDYQTALGGRALRQVSLRALPYYIERGWKKVQAEPRASAGASARDGIAIARELPAPDPTSPKFEAIAQRVAAQRSCGHIVFCEPTAAHQWLRKVLVAHGIPDERIAVLNADATTPADRVRIAQEFNGDEEMGIEPLYDVVIANSVAYEGVDLQVRTCAIHHADLPWTPADLEQRNGRGFRQGNTLGVIEIYYYLARGSMDLFRFDLIDGKAGWMGDLIAGNRETNNPAAQEDMSPEEILIALSGDPKRTRAVLDERRRREAEAKRQAARVDANRLLRRASARLQAARDTLDMERAATL
ncbi:MAG TPA: SNF2-related protein, partial [Nannocystaceae bacterium]|nr:SNF2-related protein [Nannocystaceae bacterium]